MEEEALNIWWLLTCNYQKYKKKALKTMINLLIVTVDLLQAHKKNKCDHPSEGWLSQPLKVLNRYEETLVMIQEAVIADYPAVH